MIGGAVARRRQREDGHENPAWPALVDLFAFGMVVMLLLWVQALPEPPKPPPPMPDPRQTGLENVRSGFSGVVNPSDFVWDPTQFVLRLVRFRQREIFFVPGRFNLKAQDVESIKIVARELSARLKDYPQVVVVVNGTADPTPLSSVRPPRDNVELSALRAAEVSRVLVQEGLQQKLQVVGLGEQGDATGKSPQQLQQYRQVFLELKWIEPVGKTDKTS
jgi:outer membrane protein OmpA-like peptidoglycan-associated protein